MKTNEQNTVVRKPEEILGQMNDGENKEPACTGEFRADGEDRAAERDFFREVKELAENRPEVQELFRSGGRLPDEVIQACAAQDVPLRVAYAEYEAECAKAELVQLRRENEILRQNAAAKARAPVKGTAAGGGTDIKGKDPFLEGLLSDD